MIAPSLLHVGPQPVVTGALSGVKHFDTGFLHAIRWGGCLRPRGAKQSFSMTKLRLHGVEVEPSGVSACSRDERTQLGKGAVVGGLINFTICSCWTRDPLRPRPSTKKQLQQPFCAYVCDPKNELVASAPEQSRSAHRGSQKRKFGTGAGLGRNSSAMATQKKSVDEIWKELNKRPAPRTPAGTAGIPNIPGISSMVRTVPKPKPSLLAEGAAGAGGLPDAPEAERKPAATYDPSKVGLAAQDVDTYVAGIQRLINCLSDPDRATRRQAAVSLQTKLTQGDAATPKATPQMLQALVCGPLLYPLITMLKDVVEKCRSGGVVISGHFWMLYCWLRLSRVPCMSIPLACACACACAACGPKRHQPACLPKCAPSNTLVWVPPPPTIQGCVSGAAGARSSQHLRPDPPGACADARAGQAHGPPACGGAC